MYVGKNLSIQLEDFNDPSSDSFQLLWLSIITNDDSIFFFFFLVVALFFVMILD